MYLGTWSMVGSHCSCGWSLWPVAQWPIAYGSSDKTPLNCQQHVIQLVGAWKDELPQLSELGHISSILIATKWCWSKFGGPLSNVGLFIKANSKACCQPQCNLRVVNCSIFSSLKLWFLWCKLITVQCRWHLLRTAKLYGLTHQPSFLLSLWKPSSAKSRYFW